MSRWLTLKPERGNPAAPTLMQSNTIAIVTEASGTAGPGVMLAVYGPNDDDAASLSKD